MVDTMWQPIIDNTSNNNLEGFLNHALKDYHSNLDIASAFFNIEAFGMVRENIKGVKHFRLLLGKFFSLFFIVKGAPPSLLYYHRTDNIINLKILCGGFGLPEEEEEVQVVWPRIHTQQAQEILLF